MTHKERIKNAIKEGHTTIQGILNFTGDIPEPSIRRVLGQGAKKGIFTRVDRGIYTLTTDTGEERIYLEKGHAENVLPRMEAEGRKFDMAFLDIAYFSKALVGGNRGIKDYQFLMPYEFSIALKAIKGMMRHADSHIYLMLSGAPTAQKDMQKYLDVVDYVGLKVVGEGTYKKLFKNGKPCTNVLGNEAAAERLLLITRSGHYRVGEIPVELDFKCIRPAIKGNYSTQKNEEFLDQLIRQSTLPDEVVLDPCAGSGKTGERSFLLNRISVMIETLQSAIDNFIIPKILKFA